MRSLATSRRTLWASIVLAAALARPAVVRAQDGGAVLAASALLDAAAVSALASAVPVSDYATPYTFTTLAGVGGLTGAINGTGTASTFGTPSGVAVDANGNLYVADTDNSEIRKITAAGVVTTLAGSPANPGGANGTGAAAQFSLPYGVAVDGSGNVYVADSGNNTIRKITPAGVVTTLAGLAGIAGVVNGTGSAARFNFPQGVAVDAAGNVYVADSENGTIRKITAAGVVTTLAGTAGDMGSANGTGAIARFNLPQGVAVDAGGNVYVADTGNVTIRKITAAGVVTTLAGTAGVTGGGDGTGAAALFNSPEGVAVDAGGNVFVADSLDNVIRMISSTGVVTTIAGTVGATGVVNGKGAAALFNDPGGVAVDTNGNVYVADTVNDTIRKGSLGGGIIGIGVGTGAAPTISVQPKSVTTPLGGSFSFSVTATGSPAPTYQWLLNGAAIAGATSATYSVSSSISAEAGSYTVVVSNSAGEVTSSAATLAFGAAAAPGKSGGGAPSQWFDGAVALLVAARLALRRRQERRAARGIG